MAIWIENRKSFPPHVFCALAEEFGTGARVKKTRMMGRNRAKKQVRRYLQPCGYSAPTWQTDGHRTTTKNALTHSVAR